MRAVDSAPGGAEALGHVRHRQHPVPGVRVEQRLDPLEHGRTLILREHCALAPGADELDEILPPEQLHVGERRPLDRPEEPALVDVRGHCDDTVIAELAATDDRVRELRDPSLRVVAGVPDERDPARRPQHPGHLGKRDLVVEPVKRLRARDDVRGAVR